MIRFWCECGRQLQAAEQYVGQAAACPLCNRTTIIPPADQPRPGEAPRGRAVVNEYGEIDRGRAEPKRGDEPPPYRPPPRPPAQPGRKSGLASAAMHLRGRSLPLAFALLTGPPAR